jgi:lipopolysaccharide/colanic/teichoic acid biosynthesis glycosyltransferase
MKRVFDISVSFLGLILLTPLFIIICLLILIDDKRPVLYKQNRVGKDGKPFVILKFRSMRVISTSESGTFEPGNLSRITTIGKFLRKTKIDELPQLINVLKGDMSIVGPRPEVEKWIAVYPERWRKILKVKPGITDNASIRFYNEEKLLSESNDPEYTYRDIILPKKLELYEDYVENNSFYGDLKLIFNTISLFRNKNKFS